MAECINSCPECWSVNTVLVNSEFTYKLYHCNVCGVDFKQYATPTKENNMKCTDINHPKHYANGMKVDVECIMYTCNLDFVLGNAFKYIWRSGEKLTEAMDKDLLKAKWYLDYAIKQRSRYTRERCTTRHLIPFLPKSMLLEWKYNILACILSYDLSEAMTLLVNGMDSDTAS